MKSFIAIVTIGFSALTLTSCNNNFYREYTGVNGFEDYEINLKMNKDSSFELVDSLGCFRFYQKGKFVWNDTAVFYKFIYMHVDSSWSNGYSRKLLIGNNDTLQLLLDRRILAGDVTFNPGKRSPRHLRNKSYHGIKQFYINKFSRKGFIYLFGDQKSARQARRNIEKCNPV